MSGRKPAHRPLHAVRGGERIDGFKVGRLLHEGGMARLYRVAHARHRLPMVMKVPRLDPHAPPSAFAAFENECHILERLHGPHVPRFIAAGDLLHAPYLVMEYIEGDLLAQAARSAPHPPGEVVARMAPVCRAVHELHRQSVIHLDLNPRNVRVRANGEAVLVDFGIAHHAQLPDLIDAAYGGAEGTAAYIAPEQLAHVRSDLRSDIYALGVMLYELSTGRYPFGRPNLLSQRRRLIMPPRPPRAVEPGLPPWLQEVILRCLELRPEARYSTARQVAHSLMHPEDVVLTRRARLVRDAAAGTRIRAWWRSLYHRFDETTPLAPRERLARAPHVLVALDLARASAALQDGLRNVVQRLARSEPHSTFTCLAVVPPPDVMRARAAPGVEAQVEMRHWAAPLRLSDERLNFVALSGSAVAATILKYARTHQVDQIVLGARGSSAVRRVLGSVAARVAAEAACTVTVVRTRRDRASQTK